MGIDTGSKLIVGLVGEEMPPHVLEEIDGHEDGAYGVLSEDGKYGLESCSPHFDADWDVRVWGFSVASADWRPAELPSNYAELIEAASAKFRDLIGADPKVYVCANVW